MNAAGGNSAYVALVTGGAKRLGRAIVLRLHEEGYRVCVHYNHSHDEAVQLQEQLCARRPGSAIIYQASLDDDHVHGDDNKHCNGGRTPSADGFDTLAARCDAMIAYCVRAFFRCDVLVNNASSYIATPLLPPPSSPCVTDMHDGDDVTACRVSNGKCSDAPTSACERAHEAAGVRALLGSNMLAPYYLTRAFARVQQQQQQQQQCDNDNDDNTSRRSSTTKKATAAHETRACIVNLCDAMCGQPLHHFTLYTMCKDALASLTRAAALELAPLGVRVNGVAIGLATPPVDMSADECDVYRCKVPLHQREATGDEVAAAVCFLASPQARYTTGSFVNVDGAWSLTRA